MLSYLQHIFDYRKRPVLLRFRSSKTLILTAIYFAIFTDIFLYALIVPVVPFSLIQRSQITPDRVSTYVSILVGVYGGSLAVTSPLFGWLADQTRSRRAPFIGGLIMLAAATVMLHLGRSIGILIAGRVVQGASASVVWIVGLALLADTVPPEEIGAAMGYIYLSMSLGILLGPLLGGIVFDKAGYDAVFAMAYAVIGFDVALRIFSIEKAVAKRWLEQEDDSTGLNLDLESHSPCDAPDTQPTPETQSASSVVTLLKSTRLLVALWGSIVVAILMTSLDSVLPLYVKATFDWTSLGAGLLFLAVVVPSFLGPIVGKASDIFGPKWIATTGFLLAVPAETLCRFVTHNTLSQKVLLVALLALIGLSTDMIITPIMVEVTAVVEQKNREGRFGAKGAYAQAYGLFNMSFAIGCMIGPFWGGFVRSAAGWGTLTWSLAALCGVSALPTAIWCGGRRRANKED